MQTQIRLIFTFVVLLLINTMNFFDRQILPAVQEKIRENWKYVTDFDLGLLGTAFIVLYAIVGLPLGRLADVWRRKWILAIGVFLWSVMTMASGFAWNYWSLFAMRLGVGVGEASCAPAGNSLIGDLVRPERRARALSVFMLGLPVGLALSFLISAELADRYSWQTAFVVAGAPGLLLAVLVLFIHDPVREAKGVVIDRTADARSPSFVAVTRRILRLPTMWWIILSGALHNFNMYALMTFMASLLRRYHQVTVTEAGRISALVCGFGALGIFAAGWLGDRAFRRGASGRLHVAWISLTIAIPCLLLALQAPPGALWQCFAWLMPGCMLLYAYYGTVYATIQDIIEPPLRGMAMAIYFCAMYFLGGVFGPSVTGWLSDFLARSSAEAAGSVDADGSIVVTAWHKALGLHDAMYAIPLLNAVLVLVLIAAARTVRKDYAEASHRSPAQGENA